MKSKTIALGAFGRRIRARKGPAAAIKALARKLAVLFYHAMTKGIEYVEQGVQQYKKRVQQQKIKAFLKQADDLGVSVDMSTLSMDVS